MNQGEAGQVFVMDQGSGSIAASRCSHDCDHFLYIYRKKSSSETFCYLGRLSTESSCTFGSDDARMFPETEI